MANYNENTRTNYFRVTDEEKFSNIINSIMAYEDTVEYWSKTVDGEDYFAFGVHDGISGVCDCDYCRGDGGEECESEPDYDKMCEMLQQVVHPNDAIIIVATGYEKLRYVGGNATIITTNKIEYIDLWQESIKLSKKLLNNENYDTDISY